MASVVLGVEVVVASVALGVEVVVANVVMGGCGQD